MRFLIWTLAFWGISVNAAFAQDSLSATSAPKVYIDCQACDIDYLKTEFPFPDYVRDRQEADIHILVTSQQTGNGGTRYYLQFIGQGPFNGQHLDLDRTLPPEATSDQTRQELLMAIKLGLAKYLIGTPLSDQISVDFAPKASTATPHDPWNSWVFTIGLDGMTTGERTNQYLSSNLKTSADRVTEDYKMSFGASGSYNRQTFIYDGQKIPSETHSGGADALVVKSLGPHWSVGGKAFGLTSSYSNIDWGAGIAPAVEYSVFPYKETATKELLIYYQAMLAGYDYSALTSFGKLNEWLFSEMLKGTLNLVQPWGSTGVNLYGSNYFHDLTKGEVGAGLQFDINVLKGLSLTFYGNGSITNFQPSLASDEPTLEETLLKTSQQETTFNYWGLWGIQYRFGSQNANVVNPRFGQ